MIVAGWAGLIMKAVTCALQYVKDQRSVANGNKGYQIQKVFLSFTQKSLELHLRCPLFSVLNII